MKRGMLITSLWPMRGLALLLAFVGPILIPGWLLPAIATARAAPMRQENPAAQCAEGVRLSEAGQTGEALPLLEAGFAGRDQVTFASANDLGLCAMGLGLLRNRGGDPDGALEAYTVALEAFRQGGDHRYEGAVQNGIGNIYYAQNRYDEALGALQQACELYQAVGDQVSVSSVLTIIGQIYNHQGRYDEARDLFQQVLDIAQEIGDPDSEASAFNELGQIAAIQGDLDQAFTLFQQALPLAAMLADRSIEGTVLNNLGQVYYYRGEYDQALASFQQALTIRRTGDDRQGEGETLNNIGVVYLDQGAYEQALGAFQQALPIIQAINDRVNENSILNNIGLIYDYQGQYGRALEYYQRSLKITHELGEREDTNLHNIAEVYRTRGQYAKALEAFQQALAVEQELNDLPGQSDTLNAIGVTYGDQGRYQEALNALQRALAIRREVKDRSGEGTTLSNIGTIYWAQGQYAQALEAFQQALSVKEANGAPRDATLNNIGSVYQDQGQFEHALEAYQEALIIRRATAKRPGEAATLNNIGSLYHDQGRYEQALEALEQALPIWQELDHQSGLSATLGNIGHIYDHLGQYAEALETLQQALTIEHAIGDQGGEGYTLHNIALVYEHRGEEGQSLIFFQQALAMRQSIGDRLGEAATLDAIGPIYTAQGQPAQALASYQQAMDVLEQVRATAGSEQARAGFIGQYAGLYTRAAALAQQQGQDEIAFQISERGRARAFLDSLATGYVQLSDNEAQALLTREQEAYAARQAAQDALAQARAANPPDPALVSELEQQFTAAEQAYGVALDAIEQRDDELAALVPGRTSGVLAVKDVQALLDPATTLVSFFVADDQTLAFVLTHDRFTTVALPLKRADLDAQVRALLQFANTTEPYPPAAVQLYEELISPLKAQLTTRHLALVPHGTLHYLPFAALTDGRRFLIDDYALTVLPSASGLTFIQQNVRRPAAAPLVLGNPVTNAPGMKPLTYAQDEAIAIAQLYSVSPLLGPEATAGVLHARVSQAGIVHLAAHGIYDQDDPLASAIFLTPEGDDTGQLTTSSIYGLDLSAADLVVLSACQTQQGELSAGDEVVGLTRAFFFAGTPSVIASLWSVDDEATGLLMERFYTHLRAGMGKAEALRQAQLELRELNTNPYFWAAFVLSGDPGAIELPLGQRLLALWPWLVGGGLLVAGAAGANVALRRRRRSAQVTLENSVAMAPATQPPAPPAGRDDLLAALLAQAPRPNRGDREAGEPRE